MEPSSLKIHQNCIGSDFLRKNASSVVLKLGYDREIFGGIQASFSYRRIKDFWEQPKLICYFHPQSTWIPFYLFVFLKVNVMQAIILSIFVTKNNIFSNVYLLTLFFNF